MTGQWQTWSHGSFCARKTVGTIDAIELGRERRHALPPLPAALVGRLVSPITPVSPTTPIRFPHKSEFVQTGLPLA